MHLGAISFAAWPVSSVQTPDLLQVDLLLLIPLRIIMGISLATCYVMIGGFSHPWLQAIGLQLCSYCISVVVDMCYRSTYRKLMAHEAALAANAAAGASGSKP